MSLSLCFFFRLALLTEGAFCSPSRMITFIFHCLHCIQIARYILRKLWFVFDSRWIFDRDFQMMFAETMTKSLQRSSTFVLRSLFVLDSFKTLIELPRKTSQDFTETQSKWQHTISKLKIFSSNALRVISNGTCIEKQKRYGIWKMCSPSRFDFISRNREIGNKLKAICPNPPSTWSPSIRIVWLLWVHHNISGLSLSICCWQQIYSTNRTLSCFSFHFRIGGSFE